MSLDATAREANVRDSIKKFFVDNIYNIEGIKLTFDVGLSTPKVQGVEVDKWVSVTFGTMEMGIMGDVNLDIYLCTKQDKEGFRLAQLRDTVMGYLSDTDKTDGMKRIPLYRSHRIDAWTVVGYFLVVEVMESEQFEGEDETKYKILSTRLKWTAKI